MQDITDKPLTGVKFIDLFAGRLALESFGGKCVFSSEWDKYAQEVYALNFGEIPHGDITQIPSEQIPTHDILCAGFPCQAFSISGKRKGFEDSRGTLFFEVARIVKEKQPKVVFLENVKNFASHDGGNTLATVKAIMTELGYDFYAQVLNAKDYGIPQKRERIYMIGFRQDLGISEFSFPPKTELKTFLEDLLLPDAEASHLIVKREDLQLNAENPTTNSPSTIRLGIVGKGGQGERIYSPKGIAITLSAYGGGIFAKTGGYLVNANPRKLHPRECARVMGYPDCYQIHPSVSQAYKQFGNSVVIDVLQEITRVIAQRVFVNQDQ